MSTKAKHTPAAITEADNAYHRGFEDARRAMEERQRGLLEALEAAHAFMERLYRESPELTRPQVLALQSSEQTVRGAIAKARGE